MEGKVLAKSATAMSSFIPSRSPYYKPVSQSYGKKLPLSKVENSEKALLHVKSERKNVEELLDAMEKRVVKLKRKEEHAARRLALAKDKAQVFQSARDFVKDVRHRSDGSEETETTRRTDGKTEPAQTGSAASKT